MRADSPVSGETQMSNIPMKFVKTAIDFAIAITGKDGKRHHHGNFSFRVKKLAQSMLGGNTAEVWYRQENQHTEVVTQVLKVWWQFDVENFQINTFDSDPQWQYDFRRTVERRKEVAGRDCRLTRKERTKYVEEMYQRYLAEKKRAEQAVQQQREELLERFRERAKC